jgi:hypothetical protein
VLLPDNVRRRISTALPDRTVRVLRFLSHQGRLPRIERPRTFNEKVNWRILRDRRPELAWTCDKLLMKERAGAVALVRVPETFWAGTDVAELHDVELPGRWVFKANHSCGRVHFGSGPVGAGQVDELTGLASEWLRDRHGDVFREWAYTLARPLLLVEEFVGMDASVPDDYKFFVIGGRVEMIQVDLGRFSTHTRSLYSPDWRKLPVTLHWPDGGEVAPPPRLDEMKRAAEQIAAGLDFLRVDLYAVAKDIWFGEVTPYPGGGLERFIPRAFDFEIGRKWQLPAASPAVRTYAHSTSITTRPHPTGGA